MIFMTLEWLIPNWSTPAFIISRTISALRIPDAAFLFVIYFSVICTFNSYLQYPFGVVYLKDLFTSSAGKKDNNSPITVKKQLKAIIASENPNKPYSDSTLSNLLKQKGIKISRRTVAKYREAISASVIGFNVLFPVK